MTRQPADESGMSWIPATDEEIDRFIGKCIRRMVADKRPETEGKSHALISAYVKLLVHLLLCRDEEGERTLSATLSGRELEDIACISMGSQPRIFDLLEKYGYIHVERKQLHPRYRSLQPGKRHITLIDPDRMQEMELIEIPSLSTPAQLEEAPTDASMTWRIGEQIYQAQLINISPAPIPPQRNQQRPASKAKKREPAEQ